MNTNVRYTGAVPGADSNAYTLFTTVDGQIGANFFAHANVKRVLVRLINAAAGVVTLDRSDDGIGTSTTTRGTNWNTVVSEAVAASATNDENVLDFNVEGFPDCRVVWTNGGSSQAAAWEVTVVLLDDRALGGVE